jgi:hypothetical protein
VKAPRLIAKDLGGFNGFEVGPDGQLYGPLWFKGAVARMNPENGAVTVLNSEFQVPAAVKREISPRPSAAILSIVFILPPEFRPHRPRKRITPGTP